MSNVCTQNGRAEERWRARRTWAKLDCARQRTNVWMRCFPRNASRRRYTLRFIPYVRTAAGGGQFFLKKEKKRRNWRWDLQGCLQPQFARKRAGAAVDPCSLGAAYCIPPLPVLTVKSDQHEGTPVLAWTVERALVQFFIARLPSVLPGPGGARLQPRAFFFPLAARDGFFLTQPSGQMPKWGATHLFGRGGC